MNDDSIYTQKGGVDLWISRCGFLTNEEAASVLQMNIRTFYRHKAMGLPGGLYGHLVIDRMREIENRRARAKKAR